MGKGWCSPILDKVDKATREHLRQCSIPRFRTVASPNAKAGWQLLSISHLDPLSCKLNERLLTLISARKQPGRFPPKSPR
jgi:hypothetical protein